MKNPQKQQQFLQISPEDQLKQLSYVSSVQKIKFQNSKINRSSDQKFTIESWDISQKLKPNQKSSSRYKDTLSTRYSTNIKNYKYRAQSAILKKDLQQQNVHNFNSRSRNSISPQKKQKFLFFNHSPNRKFSPQKSKTVRQFFNEPSSQRVMEKQKIYKSRRSIQTQRVRQKQQRMKTIQNYLSHKKQQIIRQKQILFTQRTGMQKLSNILTYPIQYSTKPINWNNSIKQKKKRLSKKAQTIKIDINSFQKSRKNTLQKTEANTIIHKKMYLDKHLQKQTKKDHNQTGSDSTKQNSPIKRFQNFLKKLNRYQINQTFS